MTDDKSGLTGPGGMEFPQYTPARVRLAPGTTTQSRGEQTKTLREQQAWRAERDAKLALQIAMEARESARAAVRWTTTIAVAVILVGTGLFAHLLGWL
ncbi:MAG TPA: hypothetical protein VFY84_19305 [Jiangellales bacterium]|nr:hypothetical protein [Jiangellales bacterium]